MWNRLRYYAGRRIVKTIAYDGFAAVKILDNTIKSDGMLKWQVLHVSPFAEEEEGETVVGTPEQLEMFFLEEKLSHTGWELLLEHPHGQLWVPVMEWIKNGPGARQLLSPSKARTSSTDEEFPVSYVVPLRYRNSRISRFLISLGLLRDPWSGKAKEVDGGRSTRNANLH